MPSRVSTRSKTLEQVLGPLEDDEFWRTSSSDSTQPSVEAAVARNARRPTGEGKADPGHTKTSMNEKGRGGEPPPSTEPSIAARVQMRTLEDPDADRRSLAPRAAGSWVDVLRPRNARRSITTGRIAVRMPEKLMRCFNATARARAVRKAVLFERVLVGFLDRLDRDGPELLTALQRELEIGPRLALEDDVWSDTGVPVAVADREPRVPMAQMSHSVSLEVERRFDETSWRLEVAKDALGRLIIAGYLLRIIRQHPELETFVGFSADDLRRLAGAFVR